MAGVGPDWSGSLPRLDRVGVCRGWIAWGVSKRYTGLRVAKFDRVGVRQS